MVIAEATRGLLGNLFELRDLGARDLKGVAEPVRAWVALRASTVESRFEALHPTGLTALVGRAEETENSAKRRKSETSLDQMACSVQPRLAPVALLNGFTRWCRQSSLQSHRKLCRCKFHNRCSKTNVDLPHSRNKPQGILWG